MYSEGQIFGTIYLARLVAAGTARRDEKEERSLKNSEQYKVRKSEMRTLTFHYSPFSFLQRLGASLSQFEMNIFV